jgi:pimeloyl-ACP methyl ester carboxylesterase
VFERAKAYRIQNKIPVLVLNLPYHHIRQTALAEGLFTTDTDTTTLFDVAGRTVSPYALKRMFAVSIYDSELSSELPQTFIIPADLWFADSPTLEIDFDDGQGWRVVSPGMEISIVYSGEAERFVKIRTSETPPNTQGNNFLESQVNQGFNPSTQSTPATALVQVVQMYPRFPALLRLADTGPRLFDYIWTVQAPTAFLNMRTRLEAGVMMGCGNVLDKPVIFLEGFDPDGSFDLQKTVDYFRGRSVDGIFAANNMLESLYAEGYDLIFVNWINNGAYIEANAKALEALIDYVNANKVGTAPNHVIGYSMGGLIARYCLKDMEDSNKAHQVATYFSVDAPHQGANIPLGLQFLLQFLKEDIGAFAQHLDENASKLISSSASPAARQMLVRRAVRGGGFLGTGTSVDDPLRRDFADGMQNKGWPQLCRKFGISNGNRTGLGIANLQPGDKILTTKMNGFNLLKVESEVFSNTVDNGLYEILMYTIRGLTLKRLFREPV